MAELKEAKKSPSIFWVCSEKLYTKICLKFTRLASLCINLLTWCFLLRPFNEMSGLLDSPVGNDSDRFLYARSGVSEFITEVCAVIWNVCNVCNEYIQMCFFLVPVLAVSCMFVCFSHKETHFRIKFFN